MNFLWRKSLLAFLVVGASACIFGADEDLYESVDDLPPQVVGTFPSPGATQVATDSVIEIWFSESLDPVSVNSDTILLFSGLDAATLTFNVQAEPGGQGRVSLRAWNPLIPGVEYRLVITTGVTDWVGNPLPEKIVILFRTAL